MLPIHNTIFNQIKANKISRYDRYNRFNPTSSNSLTYCIISQSYKKAAFLMTPNYC